LPQILQSQNSNPTDIKKEVEVSYSAKSDVKEKKSKNNKNQVLPETFQSQNSNPTNIIKVAEVSNSVKSNVKENESQYNKILKFDHGQNGFFASCSIKLVEILEFKKKYKFVPEIVDSSNMWDLFKPDDLQGDITYRFFVDDKKMNSIGSTFTHWTPEFDIETQYRRYKDYNYRSILPYITKYFSPSKHILRMETKLLRRYDIDTDNYCAVYYSGIDQTKETQQGSFESFNDELNKITSENKGIKILVQTDSAMFLEYMKVKNSNILVFNESIPSISNLETNKENSHEINFKAVKHLFATALIMSKCKFIVCSSGNVPLWIMQYRGNGNNVHQYSKDKWI
jgi:hypothetical protein